MKHDTDTDSRFYLSRYKGNVKTTSKVTNTRSLHIRSLNVGLHCADHACTSDYVNETGLALSFCIYGPTTDPPRGSHVYVPP